MKYTDAKLQIQDLKEVLALKEKEVEELKAARDFMPTSVSPIIISFLETGSDWVCLGTSLFAGSKPFRRVQAHERCI